MEEYQINQVRGWTEKLTAAMMPEQFVKELSTFLDKGQPKLVRLKEDIVSRITSTDTLYCATLDQTKHLCTEPLEVTYIKGTRVKPEEKLLAVVTSPTGLLSVPLCDLRHLSDEEERAIITAREEKRKRALLCEDISQSMRSAQITSLKAYETVNEIFRRMPHLVDFHHKNCDADSPHIISGDIERIMGICEIISHKPYDMSLSASQHVLRLKFPNVKIKFTPDKTPSKMHKDLFGKVYSMGDYIVDISVEQRVPSELQFLNVRTAQLSVRIGTRYIRRGLLHPHIDKSDCIDGLWFGSPCWGSYQTAVQTACKAFDLMALVQLINNFLSSCSESGWYGSVNYWNTDTDTYCACGREFIDTPDDQAVECTSCRNTDTEELDAEDTSEDEEEEE